MARSGGRALRAASMAARAWSVRLTWTRYSTYAIQFSGTPRPSSSTGPAELLPPGLARGARPPGRSGRGSGGRRRWVRTRGRPAAPARDRRIDNPCCADRVKGLDDRDLGQLPLPRRSRSTCVTRSTSAAPALLVQERDQPACQRRLHVAQFQGPEIVVDGPVDGAGHCSAISLRREWGRPMSSAGSWRSRRPIAGPRPGPQSRPAGPDRAAGPPGRIANSSPGRPRSGGSPRRARPARPGRPPSRPRRRAGAAARSGPAQGPPARASIGAPAPGGRAGSRPYRAAPGRPAGRVLGSQSRVADQRGHRRPAGVAARQPQ